MRNALSGAFGVRRDEPVSQYPYNGRAAKCAGGIMDTRRGALARTKQTRANAVPGAGTIFALRAIGLVILARWLFSMSEMDILTALSAMASSPWACINLVFLFLLIFLPGARARAERPFHPLPQWLRQALRLFALLGFLFAVWSVGAFVWAVGWRRAVHAVAATNGWLIAAPALYAAVLWICRPRALWRTNIGARRFAIGRYAISIDHVTRTAVVWMESRKVGQYDARELSVRWPDTPAGGARRAGGASGAEPDAPGSGSAAAGVAGPRADAAGDVATGAGVSFDAASGAAGPRADAAGDDAAPNAGPSSDAARNAVSSRANVSGEAEPDAAVAHDAAPRTVALRADASGVTAPGTLTQHTDAHEPDAAAAAGETGASSADNAPMTAGGDDASTQDQQPEAASTGAPAAAGAGRVPVLTSSAADARPTQRASLAGWLRRPKIELMWDSPAAAGHNRQTVFRVPLVSEGDRVAARALDVSLRQA
ncbi:hypothetical protein LMG29739_00684 [Paraburkholderia solisilvae]|uniref:Uncharacterized protein n=1 Tax=Paraburkholderia solisilvae TaxID=624376 RepID=A0A6J5D3Z2_9BURK|nr:hypothetical protein LMG29739_00684 [Paraburkholderia solisilvae]